MDPKTDEQIVFVIGLAFFIFIAGVIMYNINNPTPRMTSAVQTVKESIPVKITIERKDGFTDLTEKLNIK